MKLSESCSVMPGPAGNENKSRPTATARKPEKKLIVKNGVERAECSLDKSAALLSATATFILVQVGDIIHKECHLVLTISIQFLYHE